MKTFILNFGHPLAPRVLQHLAPAQEIKVGVHLALDAEPTAPQVVRVVDEAMEALKKQGVKTDGTASLMVVLPGMTEAAAVLLAELHGRTGSFPRVLALRRSRTDGTYGLFADSAGLGVLDLEKVRQEARGRR